MAVLFPIAPLAGQLHTDAVSGASWVWTGGEWEATSPHDVYPWDVTSTYSPGDLVLYPVGGGAGIARTYMNSSGGFISAGTVWDYTSWMPVLGAFHRGWFDPNQIGGNAIIGRGVPEPVIDGQDGYFEDDYVISVNSGSYNFATGQPQVGGTPIVPGMRVRYIAGAWVAELPPSESFRGYFDPTTDGGGAAAPFDVINSTTDYTAGNYLVAVTSGSYIFSTGTASPLGEPVEASNFIIYDGLVWQVIGAPNTLNKGWFDPTVAFGQPPAPEPVIDGSVDYLVDEYLISISAETFDFATGQPDPTGVGTRPIDVRAGDRIIRSAGTIGAWEWVHLPAITDIIKGIFDPTVTGGGPLMPAPVVNLSADYVTPDTIIASTSGYYNFGTGATGSGTWVRAGTHFTYAAATWLQIEHDGLQTRGWFDATAAGGGVAPVVVNATADYARGDYLICNEAGIYDFALGLPDVTGTPVGVGDLVRFNGLTWTIIKGGGGSTGGGTALSVTQGAHGFTVDQQIYTDATGIWKLAKADIRGTVKHGQVSEVLNTNDFVVQTAGILERTAHGMTVGSSHYLSDTTPGAVVSTLPVTGFVQLCFDVVSPDEIVVQEVAVTTAFGTTGGEVIITQDLQFPPHDPLATYDQYWAVTVGQDIYRARADATSGLFLLAEWERLGGVAVGQEPIVPDYDPVGGIYAVDQLTMNGNKMYRCIQAVVVPEPFNLDKWQHVSGGDSFPLVLFQPIDGTSALALDGDLPPGGPMEYYNPDPEVFNPANTSLWAFGVTPDARNVGRYEVMVKATGFNVTAGAALCGIIQKTSAGAKSEVGPFSPMREGAWKTMTVFVMETDGVTSSQYYFSTKTGTTTGTPTTKNIHIEVSYRSLF